MELAPIENPIVIHPHLLQKFLKQGKNYANLLALYSFYLYHVQLQKTNVPICFSMLFQFHKNIITLPNSKKESNRDTKPNHAHNTIEVDEDRGKYDIDSCC